MRASVTRPDPLELDNDLGALGRLEPWLTEQARNLEIPEPIASELRVALYELVANTILHGCEPGGKHRIEASIERDGAVVRLTLRDDARPFDPTRAPEPEPFGEIAAAPIGGLGLKLVRAYSDGLGYAWREGKNHLTLTRGLP